MAKEVREIMTIHNSMSIPRDSLLVTVLVTTLENHQRVCLDMNRVVCCKYLFLFFSSKYTQLCSILLNRVNAINGLRDKGMKSTSYKTKKGISRMTLNHLVKGSNPLRPIDSTTIEDFTLYRFLYRLENHSNKINDRDGIEGRASLRRLWRVQPCLCQKYPPLRVAGYKSMPHLSDLDHPCSKICVAVVEWLTR